MPRAEERRRAQGQRLGAARKMAGYRSAREAALANGWPEGTYRSHENGNRTIGQDDAERYARRFRSAGVDVSAQEIMFGSEEEQELVESERQFIPVMGKVGAGGDVQPEYEQVPFDGLEQIELPETAFVARSMVAEPVGFRVDGDSMYPRFKDGDILIVEREQPWSPEQMIGDEVVVMTGDGQRFVKIIRPGSRRHVYNLESIDRNFMTMEDVRIRWASPVRMIIPNVGLRRIPVKQQPRGSAGRAAARQK